MPTGEPERGIAIAGGCRVRLRRQKILPAGSLTILIFQENQDFIWTLSLNERCLLSFVKHSVTRSMEVAAIRAGRSRDKTNQMLTKNAEGGGGG